MKWSLCLIVLLCSSMGYLYADGSKEFYGNGKGNRAFLESVNPLNDSPFGTLGKHYVYAEEGEVIAVASSAQNMGLGRIRVTSPSGKVYKTSANNVGRIMDRGEGTLRAEIQGPRVGYDPYEIKVSSSEIGIWSVEFFSPFGEYAMSNSDFDVPDIPVSKDWVQPTMEYVVAWDVSVRDSQDSRWISGRVFTNILTLRIHSKKMSNAEGAFHGTNYVLTDDGHVYRVHGNGSNGIHFSYFVNNKGFLDTEGNPLYKSINTSKYHNSIHNPTAEDSGVNVTHKMFYTFPDKDMPAYASGAFPGENTWLYTKKSNSIRIENIRIVGIEGTENKLGRKGSLISFETNQAGIYKLSVDHVVKAGAVARFAKREFTVQAQVGRNEYFWDGLDGAGKFMSEGGNYGVVVEVASLGGEVHFPYLDMEINPMGILIEEMIEENLFKPTKVYWDDSEVSAGKSGEMSKPVVNKEGISSAVNGHKWGTYADTDINWLYSGNDNYGSYSFGNNKGMDTWAFTAQSIQRVEKQITVNVMDLAVEEIQPSSLLVTEGESFSYTLWAKNYGPSQAEDAVLMIRIPELLTLEDVKLYSSCARETDKVAEEGVLKLHLHIPVGCEVQYVLHVKVPQELAEEFYGALHLEASLLRDLDTTDPDATDVSLSMKNRRNIYEDCTENGLGRGCNNILANMQVMLVEGMPVVNEPETEEPDNPMVGGPNIGRGIIESAFLIPNVFSPNGDGINDRFVIVGAESRGPVTLEVFNRHGKRVYFSSDYQNDWNGDLIEDGSYFLIVRGRDLAGKQFRRKSHLVIIRKLYAGS